MRVLGALLLSLVTAVAAADDHISVGPTTTAVDGTWVETAQAISIVATIMAVDPTTGDLNTSATSISEVVLEYQTCEGCTPQQFPKIGSLPITNIDGNGRSFSVKPHILRVRWKVKTISNGRVKGMIRTECEKGVSPC